MRTGKIVAGNWKLNPPRAAGLDLFEAIIRGVEDRPARDGAPDVWIIPPAPYLGLWAGGLGAGGLGAGGLRVGGPGGGGGMPARVGLGCQDVSVCGYGAHTGEIGAELFADFGCGLALAGHSERRTAGETDARVAEKVRAADAAGMIPLLCVGESEAERDSGDTIAVVARQLAAVTAVHPADRPLWIAYEPVWAIGTGRTATPAQVVEVHAAIRESLVGGGRDGSGTPILYGGSVKPANAGELLSETEIDGALVGGASLEAESFLAIIAAGMSVSS